MPPSIATVVHRQSIANTLRRTGQRLQTKAVIIHGSTIGT